MPIPVFINTYNRLTTTKNLAEKVASLPEAVPIIIDNKSCWPPLVEWLQSCPYEVWQAGKNYGHQCPWRYLEKATKFWQKWGQEFYVITDCDLDISDVPIDVLEVLKEPLKKYKTIIKSGLSLRIDDLPEWQGNIKEWESRWWKKPIDNGRFYVGAIDTTFFMSNCKTDQEQTKSAEDGVSVRSAPPYCARHVPWYLDCENMDPENEFYFRVSKKFNSWKPSGKGFDCEEAKKRREEQNAELV